MEVEQWSPFDDLGSEPLVTSEYKIVSGAWGHMESEVPKLMADGWKPHGGISAISLPGVHGLRFAQAMVRK